MAPRCSSTWPISPFPLTRKRKKGIQTYRWRQLSLCQHPNILVSCAAGKGLSFWHSMSPSLLSHYTVFTDVFRICFRQVKKRSELLGFPIFIYYSTPRCLHSSTGLRSVRSLYQTLLGYFGFHSGNLTTHSVQVKPKLRGTILEITSSISLLFIML